MTTTELIELLKRVDPDGNMEIELDGCFYNYKVRNVEKYECKDEYTGEPIYWLEIC